MKRKILLLTFSMLAMAIPARAAETTGAQVTEPRNLLEENTVQIREMVLKSSSEEEMRERVKGIMEQFVHFEEFGRLALGSRWEKLDEAQRKVYLEEFRGLLQRTYLRRFKAGKDFEVKYRSDARYNKKGDRAEVQTTIVSGDVAADVDYRFHKTEAGWRVYDIVVDEVSMMRNYRKSFIRIYKKDGFDALIERMRKQTGDDEE